MTIILRKKKWVKTKKTIIVRQRKCMIDLCFQDNIFIMISLNNVIKSFVNNKIFFLRKMLTSVLNALDIKLREMLTSALKVQVNDSNIEIIYWNVCIASNI